MAVALLNAGANIEFASTGGFTPLMIATMSNNASVVMLLLERGADGTKRELGEPDALVPGSTALDIARTYASNGDEKTLRLGRGDFAETLAVLRLMCCSACGVTSAGLSATTPGVERRLKRCGKCPARGPCAHYCSKECQRADWVKWHRGECAEARRARQAAGTEV